MRELNRQEDRSGRTIFQPVGTLAEFAAMAEEFRAALDRDWPRPVANGAGGEWTGPPVPVWTGPRRDLLDGVALAADLYPGVRRPPVCDLGVVVGDGVPRELRRFARPFAGEWLGDRRPPAGTEGSLLIVGCHAELRAAVLRPVLEEAYLRGRDVFLLTGRDPHSLAWAMAKQYGDAGAEGVTGLFTELDELPLPTRARYFHAGHMETADIQAVVLGQTWNRVLFNGHGTDDSINLGRFTVCGLSPVAAGRTPVSAPRCAYGRGCYKPEDKLIAAHRVRAAEIVLSGCDSGPLVDLAAYDPAYQLLMNAIDGPAQALVASLSMHQSGRVENAVWLDSAARGGSTARVLNDSLRDIHPYPTFVQVGLPSSGYTRDGGDPAPSADGAEVRALVRTASARLQGLLTTTLLSPDHPLRGRLERLAERIEASSTRLVMGLDTERRSLLRSLDPDLQSLDRALAERISADPEDDVMEFPRFFGHRSSVADEDVTGATCLCGRPAWRYLRRGFTARIPDTVALGCLRCGPIGYSFAGGVTLGSSAPATVTVTGTLRVEVEVEAPRRGVAQVGVSVPGDLRARIHPGLHRVRLRAGERRRVDFDIAPDPAAAPQEYHYTVFGVQDLGISLLRRHFGVLPE